MPNPVIIITGASRGIGLAVTRSLLKEHNAHVVTISRTRTPELSQLIQEHKQSLLALECNVTDEPAIQSAITRAKDHFGQIDGLILNAATLDYIGRIDNAELSLDDWRSHFDINFFSLVTAIRASLPSLRESKGRIVFVSSGAATGGIHGWGMYNASKAAMNSLSRTLANEEPSIVSLALAPGRVDTQMQTILRDAGAQHMKAADHQSFVDAYNEGALVNPYDVGYVIAALSVRAPLSLSGQFVRWDNEECREFQRK
ncbi:hypothetical protein DEU56DRAFT_885581 [Suillus clintonianus]|uniref:uncharacterized protein n=1 Tax=Suillus clintonianus TaxID=1904413 RepID=UPI001B87791D|nr:uncharacterized protein DEU56DRAFT_885581 [Suillus clintonianus]KAG2141040.1 hypothetical protein DEU56DRAFT_885581 [Suillus clintonianus]